MTSVLLEARPFRPFKSSEEYLIAMKEDLAEWLQTMYTHLNIHSDNFMDKLETGVVLCEHANAVRHQAFEYIEKKQAKKIMTKSVTGSLAQAQALIKIVDVKYFTTAKAGTFFARDNVSNFIKWCRQSLEIIECLLFETDDLIMRKNEKHVILCLLEVARRGARFGMLAPMLVQMERQIDREIAADQKKLASNNNDNHINHHLNNEDHDDSDSDLDDEEPVLMYGPVQQIVTNDLKSLDEMVRDLVEKCTCPTQFPMIRVSEGKYRIGDTKVLIFVRILRNHVMVRVGGGWDTLSHYLDKHDPCRCRTQHRSTQSARLVNKPGAIDLHGSQIYYDRSPTTITTITHNSSTNNNNNNNNNLGPPMNTLNRSRSKSPNITTFDTNRRSISPTTTHLTKLTNNKKSLSPTRNNNNINRQLSPQRKKIITSIQISPINEEQQQHHKSEAILQINNNDTLTDQSDTTSEMSDEGYRSLGIITSDKNKKRSSLHSQNSVEDADEQDNCIDDLNEVGLRRTQFSQRIYDNTIDLSNNNNNQSPKKKPPPSSSSLTSSTSVQQQQQQQSKVNTWNGRQKCQRPSLTIENFNRNTLTRRSVSSLERRSSSANTSPTKGRLRKELLNAVKQNNDDAQIVQQVQELLKKYGSLNVLNNEENNIDNMMIHNDFNLKRRNSSITFNRNGDERISLRTPRKDSRPDNNLSKIPAPVLHKV